MPKKETSPIVLKYLEMLRNREYPYYMIAKKFADDAETYYKPRSPAEVIYTINPKWLHREVNKEMKHEKLTVQKISYVIRAFLTGKKLKYYTTVHRSGCTNYHIELNPQVVKVLKKPDENQA